jgi:hypothetical protein
VSAASLPTTIVRANTTAAAPGKNAVSDILDLCRRENVDCLIFARNEDIQVPYEIID